MLPRIRNWHDLVFYRTDEGACCQRIDSPFGDEAADRNLIEAHRHAAAVWSFLSWCRDHGWPAGDLHLSAGGRPVPGGDSKAIPPPQLKRLWSNREIPLRERALWRLLYDSASRAEEALGLDVPGLDLASRQARARVKGGHVHLLHLQAGAPALLCAQVPRSRLAYRLLHHPKNR